MHNSEQAEKQNYLSILRGLRHSPWPARLIRCGLGLIFLYSGISKLWAPKAFARTLSRYELIPDPFLPGVAVGLPLLELLAGIGLILVIRGSLSLIFFLLVLFASVLWYGILRNLNVDCGCFSTEDIRGQAGLWQAFYRDLIMLAAVMVLFISRWRQAGRGEHLPFRVKIKRTL